MRTTNPQNNINNSWSSNDWKKKTNKSIVAATQKPAQISCRKGKRKFLHIVHVYKNQMNGIKMNYTWTICFWPGWRWQLSVHEERTQFRVNTEILNSDYAQRRMVLGSRIIKIFRLCHIHNHEPATALKGATTARWTLPPKWIYGYSIIESGVNVIAIVVC